MGAAKLRFDFIGFGFILRSMESNHKERPTTLKINFKQDPGTDGLLKVKQRIKDCLSQGDTIGYFVGRFAGLNIVTQVPLNVLSVLNESEIAGQYEIDVKKVA